MNKISCETILDLIPLVRDNVASEASRKLVEDHIVNCSTCKNVYDSSDGDEELLKEAAMNEKRIIWNMKKKVYSFLLILIVISALVGLALSDTMGMFYNILIMPFIGILGYFALEKRSYLVAISIFIFSYIWGFTRYIGEALETGKYMGFLFIGPINLAIAYSFLTIIGVCIGFLLKYAFGKEKNYEI